MTDCCNNLFEQMACLRDRAIAKVCQQSGNPFIRSLILRTYIPETGNYSYSEILPSPYIKKELKGQQGDLGIANVKGETDRYQCSLSRQYTREVLDHQTTDFIIDGSMAELESGDRFSGILCELESLDDKVTFWEMVLVEKTAEQTFTLR